MRIPPNAAEIVARWLEEELQVVADYKPLKPLPTINTDTPPHGCLVEPCPTCDLYDWLREFLDEAPPTPRQLK